MLDKILDLPVIIQGALGSFLFWLSYEIGRRTVSKCSNLMAKYNKHWKKESLIFEQIQSMAMLSDSNMQSQMIITCIYGSLNLAIKGFIYMIFGLATSEIIGPISLAAYAFSLVYFYRALNAVKFEISGKGSDYHKNRIKEIDAELEKLKD